MQSLTQVLHSRCGFRRQCDERTPTGDPRSCPHLDGSSRKAVLVYLPGVRSERSRPLAHRLLFRHAGLGLGHCFLSGSCDCRTSNGDVRSRAAAKEFGYLTTFAGCMLERIESDRSDCGPAGGRVLSRNFLFDHQREPGLERNFRSAAADHGIRILVLPSNQESSRARVSEWRGVSWFLENRPLCSRNSRTSKVRDKTRNHRPPRGQCGRHADGALRSTAKVASMPPSTARPQNRGAPIRNIAAPA